LTSRHIRGGDGAATPPPNRSFVEWVISTLAIAKRLRVAQAALDRHPSAGGRAICAGLQVTLDMRLFNLPNLWDEEIVHEALERSIRELHTPPAEGGGS
jgi:hypothetical protein